MCAYPGIAVSSSFPAWQGHVQSCSQRTLQWDDPLRCQGAMGQPSTLSTLHPLWIGLGVLRPLLRDSGRGNPAKNSLYVFTDGS